MSISVTYVGPFDEIEHQTSALAYDSDVVGWAVTVKGEPVEVSDEIGALLLEQSDNWQATKPKKVKADPA